MTRIGVWLFPSQEASVLVAVAEQLERLGDAEAACGLITDRVLDQYVLHGDEDEIASRIAEIAARHRPASIGLSLLGPDPAAAVPTAAAVLGSLPAVVV